MVKHVDSSNNDFRNDLTDLTSLKQIGKPNDNKTVIQNTSLNTLAKAIMKKLDTGLYFGNFFNGLHNKIANKINHQREIKLNEALDNIKKSYNSDKTFEVVGLKESKIITNLPKSVQKLYDKFTPSYGLSILRSGDDKAYDEWASSETIPEKLQALRDLTYVAVEGKPIPENKTIPVSADEFVKIHSFTSKEIKSLVDEIKEEKDFVGEGSFGVVYKVEGKDGKTYAVKIAKTHDGGDKDNSKGEFFKEKRANEYLQANLSEEDRKYFVDYHGGFEIDGQYVFVTEFIDKPEEGRRATFDKYIEDVYKDGKSTKDDLTNMTMLLQQGFEKVAIEQRIGLLNRDIKPENFMVGKDANGNLQLKGMDYGAACTYTGIADPDSKGIGSPTYMSPEILKKENYTFSSDVYSMGISLLEGLFGEVFPKKEFRFPWKIAEFVCGGKLSEALKGGSFDKLVEAKVIKQEALNNLKETLGDDADKKIGFLYNLVADCTAFNPQDRISAKQAAYLLGEFNKGEFSDYKEAKQKAINTHPKAIPDAIKNMISSEDLDTKDQGIEALKKLILADPSYIETQTFKGLGESVISEIKNSKEYKSAFEKLQNKEVSDNVLSVDNTVSAPKAESISSVQAQTVINTSNEKPENADQFNLKALNRRKSGNIFTNGNKVYWQKDKNYDVDSHVNHSEAREEYGVDGAVVETSADIPDDEEV